MFCKLLVFCHLLVFTNNIVLSQEVRLQTQEKDSTTAVGRDTLPTRDNATLSEIEQLRGNLISLCDEADQTFNVLANYDFVIESFRHTKQASLSEIINRNKEARNTLSVMTAKEFAPLVIIYPDNGTIDRQKILLRRLRTDNSYQQLMNRIEKWFDLQNSVAQTIKENDHSSGVRIRSRAELIRPVCDFGAMSNFINELEMQIIRSLLIGVDSILMGLDETAIATNLPNPAYYIALGIRTAFAGGVIAAEWYRSQGLWCQALGFNLQVGSVVPTGAVVHGMFPKGRGYGDLSANLVRVLYEKAREAGIFIPSGNSNDNCFTALLTGAENSYKDREYYKAYLLFRRAYRSIGKSACIAE